MNPAYALMIMCGLPLSGKSTTAKEYQREGWTVLCPDTVRLAIHGQAFVPGAEPFVWATVETIVRSLLMDGHRVIVDATNNTRERRRVWLRMADDFGMPLLVNYHATPARECIDRAERDGKDHMIPVIKRMADKFEPPNENDERGIELVGV